MTMGTYRSGTSKGNLVNVFMRSQSRSGGSSKTIHNVNNSRWKSSLRKGKLVKIECAAKPFDTELGYTSIVK